MPACEAITITTGDGSCPAQFCRPNGSGPWPAIILYMDAGGMRPAAVEMTEHLTRAGYAVLVPDLFYRYGPYEPLVPKEVFAGDFRAILGPLMATTDTQRASADTSAFLAYLDSRDDVVHGPIGAIGFCMGAGLAIAAAGTFPGRIAAVGSFHGGNLVVDRETSPHHFAPRMQAELLIAAASDDSTYPPEMAAAFERILRENGVRYSAETYPAKHGWMVPDFPVYDEAQAERGWHAFVALLDRQVKSGHATG